MATYTIIIPFNQETVESMNTQGFKLCFTCGFNGEVVSNVIAWADDIAANVQITWTDVYSIAATKSKFSNGATFTIATAESRVQFNENAALPPTWNNLIVTPATGLPSGSFSFTNKTAKGASAVVCKTVNGTPSPFYISSSPVLPGGTETLTPKNMAALWFEKDVTTQTMISKNVGEVSSFDMTGLTTLRLVWNGEKFIQASAGGPVRSIDSSKVDLQGSHHARQPQITA